MGKMETIPQRGEVLFLQSSVLCVRQYLGSSYQEIIGCRGGMYLRCPMVCDKIIFGMKYMLCVSAFKEK